MNTRQLTIILSILAVLFTSCSNQSRLLANIDSYIQTYPDSAYTELKKYKESDFTSRKNRAKYCTLYATALDKNYNDTSKFLDTLISYKNYYAHHGSKRDRMLYNFYLGDQMSDSGMPESAITYFSEALKYAITIQDWFYCGIISQWISILYAKQYNYNQQLEYAEKACYYLKKTDKLGHLGDSRIKLAIAYMCKGRTKESLDLIRRTYQDAKELKDTLLIYSALNQMATCYLHLVPPQPDSTIYAVRQTYSLKIKRNIDLCCSAAEAFSLLGNNVKAHAYIDSAYAAINTKHDRMIALEADYTILDREHNVSKAYPVLKHIHEISDSITTKALLQSVTVAHDKYLQEKKELADYKIKTNRVIYSLLLVLAATLILLSIKILRSEKKAHSKTKEVLVNTEQELSETESKLDNSEKHLTQMTAQAQDYKNTLRDLIKYDESSVLISMIGEILQRYYSPENKKISLEDSIGDIIETHICAKDFRDCILKYTDKKFTGVLNKFKTVVPDYKEEDLLLFALYAINMEYKVISTISKISCQTLYTRYNRLRKLIMKSDSPDKDYLLELLETRPSCATKKQTKSPR